MTDEQIIELCKQGHAISLYQKIYAAGRRAGLEEAAEYASDEADKAFNAINTHGRLMAERIEDWCRTQAGG